MTDILDAGVQNTSANRDERARKAVKAFRAMQPTLTAYARVYSGNQNVRVEISSKSARTDGARILFRPPIELGDLTPHVRKLCDKRDEVGRPLCNACAIREYVLIQIYHEIAHISEGTFDKPREGSLEDAIVRAVDEAGGKYAEKIAERIRKTPERYRNSYMSLSGLISPFLPVIINALEDARVNNNLFNARRGTRVMFDALMSKILSEGVEQVNPETGETFIKYWKDYPLNSQIATGIFLKAAGYAYQDWFQPVVEEALDDIDLSELLAEAIKCRHSGDTYELSFPILARLRELGFCKSEKDPEPEPEPEPEQEPDESGDEGEPQESDESSESEGSGGDEGESEESSDDRNDQSDSGGDSEADQDQGDDGSGGDSEEDSEGSDGGSDEAAESDSDESESDGSDDASSGQSGEAGGSDAVEGEVDEESSEENPEESSVRGDASGRQDDGDASEDNDGQSDRSEATGDDSEEGEVDEQGTEGSEESESRPQDSDGDDSGGSGDDSAESDSAMDEPGSGSSDDVHSAGDDGTGMDGDDDVSEQDGVSDDYDDESLGSQSGASGAGDFLDRPDGDLPSGEESSDLDEEPEPSSPDPSDNRDASETDAVDSGADKGRGGVELDIPDDLEMGEADDVLKHLLEMQGHSEDPDDYDAKAEAKADNRSLEQAVIQGMYFETPSSNIIGVRVNRPGKTDHESRAKMENAWDRYKDVEEDLSIEYGVSGEFDPDESIMGPALLHMRRVFADNRRGSKQHNLKSGRINAKVLGKRVAVEDPRMFKHRTLPGKKDYSVLLGMDISGSTVGVNLVLEKRAVMAQANLLQRMGIRFAVVAHSGVSLGQFWDSTRGIELDIYVIKDFNEPWSTETKENLRNIGPYAVNLDGHALEFMRKMVDRETTTDKVIMYYSDGKMPAENHDEELEILQREIRVCKQRGIKLLGVGIRTDSPTRHGLDTVEVEEDSDITKVVKHLEKHLT